MAPPPSCVCHLSRCRRRQQRPAAFLSQHCTAAEQHSRSTARVWRPVTEEETPVFEGELRLQLQLQLRTAVPENLRCPTSLTPERRAAVQRLCRSASVQCCDENAVRCRFPSVRRGATRNAQRRQRLAALPPSQRDLRVVAPGARYARAPCPFKPWRAPAGRSQPDPTRTPAPSAPGRSRRHVRSRCPSAHRPPPVPSSSPYRLPIVSRDHDPTHIYMSCSAGHLIQGRHHVTRV